MDAKLYAIQTELQRRGIDPGPIDGVWGTKTRDAIFKALELTEVPAIPARDAGAPWLDLARGQIGVKEWSGIASNPAVLQYYREAGVPQAGDDVPWCAAFVGAMLRRAGYKSSGSLMARSYLQWGTAITGPRKGAVVVLERGQAPAGHVAFVDDWSPTVIKCLGGNQGDAVSISNYARSRVLGYRWPAEARAA